MSKYQIEIQELLSRIVEVDALSSEEAIDKVKSMYKAEEIVLDSDDYVDTIIKECDNC